MAKFAGFTIVIERKKGEIRRGVDRAGNPWKREMACDYGHLQATEGVDAEPVDVFLRPREAGDEKSYLDWHQAYVIDQVHPETGIFDEHKVVLGAEDEDEARQVYLANYPPGWQGLGAITPVWDLATWLRQTDRTSHPLGLNHTSPQETRPGSQTNSLKTRADGNDPVCPECGTALEWDAGEGKCNHCGSQRPPLAPKAAPPTSSPGEMGSASPTSSRSEMGSALDSFEQDLLLVAVGDWQVVSDEGKPLRVRQLATIADSINGNDRIYPRAVLQAAIEDARPRARAGAMLSEMQHPAVVVDGREQKFVDNPDAKTARVDDISDVGADGRVYVTRTFLDTPQGQARAAQFLAGKPLGISVRWKMRGVKRRLEGHTIHIADTLHFLTVDDVPNPAVPETQRDFQLLSDSMRDALGLPPPLASSTPGATDLHRAARSTTTGAARKEITRMNETIKRLLGNYSVKLVTRAPRADVDKARQMVADAIEAAHASGEDVTSATQELLKVDALLPGYTSDRPGLTAVPGNKTGTQSGGFASEIESMSQGDKTQGTGAMQDPGSAADKQAAADGFTTEERTRIATFLDSQAKAEADATRRKEILAAVDAVRESVLKGLDPEVASHLAEKVAALAPDAAAVPVMLAAEVDSYGKLAARERLRAQGYPGALSGQSVRDPARIEAGAERPCTHQEIVDKLLAAGDDVARAQSSFLNPDSSYARSLRAFNRPIADRLVNQWFEQRQRAGNWQEWVSATDAQGTREEQALADSISRAQAAADSTSMSNLYNQPAIAAALLIQAFQWMNALQFVSTIGPGGAGSLVGPNWMDTGNGGPGHVGTVLRIPVEYYTKPSGYGVTGPQDDAGLLTPEGIGIDEGVVSTLFLPFAPQWRRIAAFLTHDVMTAMGRGPLNYAALGRHLFHLGLDKQRRIDNAIFEEMFAVSDEYGAVAVSAQTQNGANNSVYNAGGAVTVNLNPAKTAATTPAASDPAVTYGASVIGAVRLTTRGQATSAPYCGTDAGVDAVVKPRLKRDVTAAGAISDTTINAIMVSAPANMVRGYLDDDGNVATFPGGGSPATYAVDYNNAVIVFASGVSGSSGVITTTVTASYSYATNFDDFVVNNPTLATGETESMYYNRLLAQIDATAAIMGGAGRYVFPDLALMSLAAANWITQAQIFYKLASPNGTTLGPTESFFADRNGIGLARVNAPWRVGDTRIQLTRRGSTFYGVQEPFQIRGPYPKYDSNGKFISGEGVYGEENSLICTPQVQNQAGSVLNPVSRHIRLR